jgi:hypothetical protein
MLKNNYHSKAITTESPWGVMIGKMLVVEAKQVT